VPTRTITLVDQGQPRAGIFDLVVASRHDLPATGHGWRRGFAGPRIGCSNLVLAPGEIPGDRLAELVGDGLLVTDLELGPAPSRATGVFRVAVPWAYRISGGEVIGRIAGAVVGGDVFDLLARVAGVGADGGWIGSSSVPSLVIEGVTVDLR
jgi:predicted Zn-dependent protease